MLFSSWFALLATATFVSALPGQEHNKPKTTCHLEKFVTTTCGKTKTVEYSTKTVYVPVTKTKEVPSTVTKPCPETKVEEKTTSIVKTFHKKITKTKPITTYTTYVVDVPYKSTICETIPYTVVITKYTTYVTHVPTTYVTKTKSESVCSTTEYVPFTSTITETKTKCTTLGGGYPYGNGW